MSEEYIVTSPLKIYNDCSFASKIIYSLKENDVINREYNIGPWSKILYNNIEGFIYPFNASGDLLLNNDLNYKDFRINDLINLKTKNTIIKDEYGSIIKNIDENNSKQFFIIKDILNNPKLIKIENINQETFWVKPSLILKVKKDNIDKNKNPEVYENYVYDTISKITEYLNANPSNIDEIQNPASRGIGGSINSNRDLADTLQKLAQTLYNEQYKKEQEQNKQNGKLSGILTENASAFSKLRGLEIKNLRSIFGMPYQYLPIADMRMGGTENSELPSVSAITSLGIKYAEKIVSRMPLFIMVPGVSDFMQGFSSSERSTILKELNEAITSSYNIEDSFNKFLTKDNRQSFYSLYPAWTQYYNFVNPMCHIAAKMMGLENVTITFDKKNRTLGKAQWKDIAPSALTSNPTLNGGCAFYIQSETQLSESLSNSTTMSQIANKVNSISDQGRELLFLSGTTSGIIEKVGNKAQDIVTGISSSVQQGAAAVNAVSGDELLKSYENSSGAINAIMNGISNTIAGSKMLFPELWQDSAFSRDYNVTIKLDSPDNDRLSLYLNIIVPLIHLIGFAAPRFMGATTYASPFLVRAYYQGFFNINMGIITSLTINKGAEGAWTLDNIPTVVEVNIGIHDLFATNLTITPQSAGSGEEVSILGSLANSKIIQNTPMLDYVGNLCGVNINEPDLAKVVSYYKVLVQNIHSRFWDNAFGRITEYTANAKTQFYQQMLAGNSLSRWF